MKNCIKAMFIWNSNNLQTSMQWRAFNFPSVATRVSSTLKKTDLTELKRLMKYMTQSCVTFRRVFVVFFFSFFFLFTLFKRTFHQRRLQRRRRQMGGGTAPSCVREPYCPADEACWLTARQCQVTRPGMGPRTGSPSSSAWPEERRAGRWASATPRCM